MLGKSGVRISVVPMLTTQCRQCGRALDCGSDSQCADCFLESAMPTGEVPSSAMDIFGQGLAAGSGILSETTGGVVGPPPSGSSFVDGRDASRVAAVSRRVSKRPRGAPGGSAPKHRRTYI